MKNPRKEKGEKREKEKEGWANQPANWPSQPTPSRGQPPLPAPAQLGLSPAWRPRAPRLPLSLADWQVGHSVQAAARRGPPVSPVFHLRPSSPQTRNNFTWAQFCEAFRTHHVPAGLMKMKRKEFLALKQGAMSVTEYRDKFLQLARYAPADVAEDSDKQEQFMEGLNDGLQMQLLNHTFNNFNHLVDRVLLTERKRREVEKRKRRLNPSPMSSNTRPRLNPSQPQQQTQQSAIATGLPAAWPKSAGIFWSTLPAAATTSTSSASGDPGAQSQSNTHWPHLFYLQEPGSLC